MNLDMNKHFTNMTYKELYKKDIRKVKKFLLDNPGLLNYNEEYAGWFIDDEPLSYYLFFENFTFLHPKEMIGDLECYIEDELKIKK